MTAKIRVLGLDPAFANCGMAVGEIDVASGAELRLETVALISTKADKVNKKVVRKSSDDLRRTREIAGGVRAMCIEHNIDLVCVEVPTGAQSARAATALGIVVGILGSLQTPLIEVSPREVKLAVGDKFAEKEDIIKWASEKYPSLPWPRMPGTHRIIAGKAEHMADAVAVLHAGINTEEFKRVAVFWRAARAA